jgi:hypothetical protein
MSDTHSMQATGAVESTDAAANALTGGEKRGFGPCTLNDGCPAFVGTGSTCQRCGHGFGLHSTDVAAANAPTEATTEATNAPVDSAATGPGQKPGVGYCTLNDGCSAFVGTGSTCQRCGHGFGLHSDFAAASAPTETTTDATNAAANALPGGEERGFGPCTLNDGCSAFVGTGSTCQRCGHGFGLHYNVAAATDVTE